MSGSPLIGSCPALVRATVRSYTAGAMISELGSKALSAAYILAAAESRAADPADTFVAIPAPTNPSPPVYQTRTTLTAKPKPATLGKPVTLTATVKIAGPVSAAPRGQVLFLDGTSVLSTVG